MAVPEVRWSDRREQIVMSLQQYSLRCPDCGSREVAISTWERLVNCPDMVWMHFDWPLPLEEHICQPDTPRSSQPRPIWEAFES